MRVLHFLLLILASAIIYPVSFAADLNVENSAQCAESGGTWHADKLRPMGHCIPDTFDKCKGRGGELKLVCKHLGLACVKPTKDGGKSCTDNSQCERGCLVVRDSPRADGMIVGECRRDDNPCGSFYFIENGKRSGVLHAD